MEINKLDEEFTKAQAKLEKIATEEAQLKEEIEQIGPIDEAIKEEDDDELFGDKDDDEAEVRCKAVVLYLLNRKSLCFSSLTINNV